MKNIKKMNINEIYEEFSDDVEYFRCAEMNDLFVRPHFHASWEFIFVAEGSFHVLLDGLEYVVKTGEILFIPGFVVHSVLKIEKNRCFSIVIGRDYRKHFDDEFKGKTFNYILAKNGEKTEKLFNYVQECINYFSQMNLCQKYGFAASLFGTLAQMYPLYNIDENVCERVVIDILKYLEKHYTEDITVKKLAKIFGYSKNYLSSLFNKYTGMRFNDYLGRLRIAAVYEKIGYSDSKNICVTRVALDCGFNSLNTFYRAKRKFAFINEEYTNN